jgi:hypothetical protein
VIAPEHRVFVATPAYNGVVDGGYTDSMVKAATHCAERGIELQLNIAKNGVFIEICRSVLVNKFMKSDCTHLFFIDADLAFEAHALAGLVQAGVPFAAGVYRQRQDELVYNIQAYEGPDGEPEQKGPWLRANRVATGFMCLERRVLEIMTERADRYNVRGIPNLAMVFHTTYERGGSFIGEDYSFCNDYNRLYEQGLFSHPIWAYPDITFDHDGYVGNYHQSIMRMEARKRSEVT